MENEHIIRDFVVKNIPWIVAIVIGVGTVLGTITLQGILIFDLKDSFRTVNRSMEQQEVRVDSIEKSLVKIEIYQGTIQSDIEEIKKNIIKSRIVQEVKPKTLEEEIEPDFAYMRTFNK